MRATNNTNCPPGEPQLGYNSTCDTDPNSAPSTVDIDFTMFGDRRKLRHALDQYNYSDSEYIRNSNKQKTEIVNASWLVVDICLKH